MNTVEQQEKLITEISKLSELELDELLRGIAFILTKQSLNHLADSAFLLENHQELIDDLEERVEHRDQKIENLESDKQHLELKIEKAIDELEKLQGEPFGEDWGREVVEETLTILR
jgi:hypothetical protein